MLPGNPNIQREASCLTMNTIEKISYRLIYGALWCLSILPFRVLYLLSDVMSWLLHSVVRYRRRVVRENLVSSLPEKSSEEIARIERNFYTFLTDYTFETIKMLTMSPEDMHRHLRVVNPEMVDLAIAEGKSVSLLLGHYCNWEWVSSLPTYFAPDTVSAQVYHHLHSRVMGEIFNRIRTRFGANNIEMGDIMRRHIDWKRRGVATVTGYIADQCPKFDMHLFLDFLHHDTGVYTGPERISRFLDAEVLFCHLSRPRRGLYELKFIPIARNPKEHPDFEITRQYFAMLEDNILEAPQYWLWSHRRWKRTRADFYNFWGDKADKLLSHL